MDLRVLLVVKGVPI